MLINSYKKIEKCRVCGNHSLVSIVDLGEQFLTGVFPRDTVAHAITCGPLRLVKCHGGSDVCGLLQLEHSYDLGEMYGDNYGYRSGLNPSMVRHLCSKVNHICSQVDLKPGDLVVDIGSNDGTTLGAYPDNLRLVGIDPTGDKFRSYYKKHVELIPDFFSADLLAKAFPGRKAKVITSFSMFYDLESPIDFAAQIADVLDRDVGLWVFEQSYMPLMLQRNAYDTICHEHLEFYGLKQIAWIAEKAGLKIIDVELNDINGGSFSVMAAHRDSKRYTVQPNVGELLEREEAAGMSSLQPYLAFAQRVEQNRAVLRDFIENAKRDGKTVCGLGASTKGNVVLQYCSLTPSDLSSIADVNPDKFGAFAPGSCIPIRDEAAVLAENPDYLLVLPWHFRDFFIVNPAFKGRSLVFPLPYLEIVKPS